MTSNGKGDGQTSRQNIEAESIPHPLQYAGCRGMRFVRSCRDALHQNAGKGSALSFFGTASPHN
jgi:hypothetical protein